MMVGANRIAILGMLLAYASVRECCAAEVSLASSPGGGLLTGVSVGQVRSWSSEIDRLVQVMLDSAEERPQGRASDEVFLRRVYLDLAGRIPTLSETRSFLGSRHQDRREQLVDRLLDSPAYASHQYNYWADLLRAKSRLQGGNPGQPYVEFIKQSLRENLPYDDFVRRMIVSSGAALETGNGATGYYLRDFNMPEDNMANTVRLFLGTRLECAQCHDHPFDQWKQREFFEMVAFTGGMRMRMKPTDGLRPNELRRELQRADVNDEVRQVALRMLRPMSFGVVGGGTGLARLPDSYQYDDGAPNEIVTAKTMFDHTLLVEPEIPRNGSSVSPLRTRKKKKGSLALEIPAAEDIGSRVAFANWLTSPENPRFTQVIANRMWKKLFGVALIEPVDDMSSDTVASNPALMDFLTSLMRELKYDLKQFQRVVCFTEAYQREAVAVDVSDLHTFHFQGPMVRRMSAEQLWDSFVTLAVPNVDTKEGPRGKLLRGMMPDDLTYEELRDLSVADIVKLAQERVESRNDPERRKRMRRELIASMASGGFDRKALKENRHQLGALRAEIQKARDAKDMEALKAAQAKLRELAQKARGSATGVATDLVRASELSSPAPEGHFLREFGQSDREQIENANHEPAVTQVLSLMNGTIETRVISNPQTVLMQSIEEAKQPRDKVDIVFLSLLSRYPTRDEKALWLKEGEKYGASAAIDLIWTLANTNEFMFVH